MMVPDAIGLGALAQLLDTGPAQSVLASLFPQSSVRVHATRLVRLKPGKRAVVRWRATVDHEPRLYYAKLFGTARARRVDANHRAVRDGLSGMSGTAAVLQAQGGALLWPVITGPRTQQSPRVVVPEPAGHALDGTLFVMRALAGRPVAPALAGGDVALSRRIAGALAEVHGASAALERRHTVDDELGVLDNAVAALARRTPGLATEAAALAEAVRQSVAGRPWRMSFLHRDFYADQVLALGASGQTVGLIDFDDAKLGEPAVDVANFAAHLVVDALRDAERGAHVALASGTVPPEPGALVSRAAFLDEYIRLDPALDHVAVAALEAGTLLRLASIHGARSGPGLEARLVDASRQALAHVEEQQWNPVR